MSLKVLRALQRKLGSRYPFAILVAQFQLAHFVVLLGLGLLTLYQDMTTAQFWRLVAISESLIAIENAFYVVMVRKLLRPVRAWFDGDRGPESTVRAWHVLVGLPFDFVRRRWKLPIFLTTLPFSIAATAVLHLPVYLAPVIFAGALVVLLYGATLRFLGMELGLRPALEIVARELPDSVELPRAGVPLRWKLLAGLPVINIITGVVVAGLSHQGPANVRDLGADVVIAVVVAFTTSLELTILLSRSILRPIQDLREATRRVGEGDLTARVPILSTDETGALSRAFNNAVSGLEERERLREAFGMFVDPTVAERVLAEGTALEGDELEVTVLFLDIRGFTAFAERASAAEVVTRLNEFFELVVPVILRHGGHANKFVGDGLLAVFGAPDRRSDHADIAVAAALEIAGCVRARYGEELRIGIGVNSGPVVAGTIGGGGRVEFTVIGDPVNTAARVESVTRETGDDVLVTEATRCLLERDHGGFEPRPEVELKGKTERVGLWAPRAAAREEDPALTRAGVGEQLLDG